MNPIRKTNITGLAIGVAVLFATSLLAKPPAQNYPEYPMNDGAPVVQTQTTVTAQPVQTKTQTQPVTTTQYVTTTETKPVTTTQTVVTETKPVVTQQTTTTQNYANNYLGSRFDSNLITVEKTLLDAPGKVGYDYQYRVRTTALADVKQVNLTETLPDGVTFVKADPDVTKVNNSTLAWGYDSMNKGDVKDEIITVRPNMEGDFMTSTKVCIDPAVQLPFKAGTPRLAIEKVGPREAELDSQIAYTIRLSNVGTASADNVVVVDNPPAGIKTSDATPTWNVGNLNVGESRTFTLPATAAQQGDWVNHVTATSSNAASVSAEAPTRILQSKIKVTKVGPDRLFINREATYTITVANAGSAQLNNIVVTDALPGGTSLLAVSGQPVTQNKSNVVWNIPTLAPGESKSDTVTLTSPEPQTTVNNVTARTDKGLSDSANAQTIWEGPPGVLTEIVDDIDPIRTGGIVTYTIKITNQGKYREINSQIRVLFGDEITPLECTDGTANINGKIVTLPDGIIKPTGIVTFKIKAKAEKAGLSTTRLEFNSSFLPHPINKDETTYVY